MRHSLAVVVAILLASPFVTNLARSTQVLPAELPEVVERAQWAFVGRCTERHVDVVRTDQIPKGLLVTFYTFHVSQWFKGGNAPPQGDQQTIRFAQWGAAKSECRARGFPCPIGMPQYEVDQEYALFLLNPSPLQLPVPLTSTVALKDGSFPVTQAADGTKRIRGRFPSMMVGGKAKGEELKKEIPLVDFTKLVEDAQRP
ncbi:MAG: hypothetical protein HY465_00280 [Deltaproteobacteria bacterium]|nr:hypothetical protein [Deltaproteobacteria bacterium]